MTEKDIRSLYKKETGKDVSDSVPIDILVAFDDIQDYSILDLIDGIEIETLIEIEKLEYVKWLEEKFTKIYTK